MMKTKERPRIVCLCGSTRFMGTFNDVNRELTMQGDIVLSVGVPATEVDEDDKIMLDRLHLHKIDLADTVFVINVNGYIGFSTANEIEYAKKKNKTIEYLVKEEDDDIQKS